MRNAARLLFAAGLMLPVFSFFIAFGSVHATDSNRGEKFSQKLEERQLRQAQVKERVASKQADLRQDHIKRLKQVFTNILGRFRAALSRLDKIVDKLEARINKLNDMGVNTTNASAKLASCNAKKTAAEAAIDASVAEIAEIDETSTNARGTVHTSVDALKRAKGAIRDYHKCLVDVTRMLRASYPKEGTGSAQ